MFSGIRLDRSTPDEAEKPFWISYADLMTSLMVLFLLVMLAALVSLTRTVTSLQETTKRSRQLAAEYRHYKIEKDHTEKAKQLRLDEIGRFWDLLERETRGLGVRINRDTHTIDFGTRARFGSGSDKLSAADQALLRRFTPGLLRVAALPIGQKVLNRVVVEGFADRRGTYLLNLNLSSNRSQRVLCSLLAPGGGRSLTALQKRQVRDLFEVNGFSFNKQRRSLQASRRVEIRIDFLSHGARRPRPQRGASPFGVCSLDR